MLSILFGGVALASMATPSVGLAQEASTAGAVENEEIVVTARKRTESLQDVPAAISQLSGATLERTGARGIEDIVRMVPGFTMSDSTVPGAPSFNVRGVSTSTAIESVQPSVGFYIDELPALEVTNAFTPNLNLVDIERVEILRGPQGTLFGSGSLSGAVRVITRKPDPKGFEGYVEATGTAVTDGDLGYGLEGMLNIPLSDRAAMRFVAYDRERPGYTDNLARGVDDVGTARTSGGRLSLRVLPTDNLTVTAGLIYQLDKVADTNAAFYDTSLGGAREWDAQTPNRGRFETAIASTTVEYDFGGASLISATNYADKDVFFAFDASGLGSALGAPGTETFSDTSVRTKIFSQEVRLTSQGSGPLRYVLGAFYVSRDQAFGQQVRNPVVEGLFDLPNLLNLDMENSSREMALFGEVSWAMTDRLELTAGARAFRNTFNLQAETSGLLNGGLTTVDERKTEKSITPRFGAKFKVAPDISLYATASQGYRIGQANLTISTAQPTYLSDSLWNYEVGIKSELFDRRLRLNISAFHIDWKNIQVGLRSALGSIYTGNAGTAESDGVEIEALFKVTRELDFSTAIAITDARLTQDVPDLNEPGPPASGVRSGDRLPGSPRFTIANAVQYARELGEGRAIDLRLDHQYIGKSYNRFTRVGALELGGYNVFDLSAGLTVGTVQVRAFVKNIADSKGVMNATFDNFGLGPDAAFRLTPRSLGVSVRKNF